MQFGERVGTPRRIEVPVREREPLPPRTAPTPPVEKPEPVPA